MTPDEFSLHILLEDRQAFEMPHWLIKSAIQHAIAIMPLRQRWNEVFQNLGTRSLDLTPGKFEMRLNDCRIHLNNFLKNQPVPPNAFTALELGTGWFPTMIIGLYLCGAEKIWAIDIDPLIRNSRLQQVLKFFYEYDERKELQNFLPQIRSERLAHLRELMPLVGTESAEKFLTRLNIHVMVRDAQDTTLPDKSVDLIFSTGVLEYIPPQVLRGIFAEFKRISSNRAISSHWISMVDQFSYFDRSITPFNYLNYTSAQWRYFNSPLTWQSRLRICDYRQMLQEAGFQVLSEENESGNPNDLGQVKLAPEFKKYSHTDLLVLKSWMTAKPVVAR